MPQFLISNFKTGIDKELEPWLTPDDAFIDIVNGQTYRGVLSPRMGFSEWATGGRGNAPIQSSKTKGLISEVRTNNDTLPSVDLTTSQAIPDNTEVRIYDNTGDYRVIIDRNDTFSGDVTGTPTINRATGQITFDWNTGSATDSPRVAYVNSNYTSKTIMGIFNFYKANGTLETIVFDEDFANKYVATTNTLEPIFMEGQYLGSTFSGGNSDFFSCTNYPDADGSRRLIITNNIDDLAFYNGSEIKQFNNTTDNANWVNPAGVTSVNTVQHVFFLAQRLLLVKPNVTTASGTFTRGTSVYYSGINDTSGKGDSFVAPGSGEIVFSSETLIFPSILFKNGFLTFMEEDVFRLDVSESIDAPFLPEKISNADARGSSSPFSAVKWLNRCAAVGPLGIVTTDGREVLRMDNKFPYFTRDEIDQNLFQYVYGDTVFKDSQWWLLYPASEDVPTHSTKVLVYNFEEESFAKYDIEMSVIGNTRTGVEWAWDDINENTKYEWAKWDTTEDIWDSFKAEQKPTTLGGDHSGFVYTLNETRNDYNYAVSAITVADPSVFTISTPNKIEVGDEIVVKGIVGYEEDVETVSNTDTLPAVSITTTNPLPDGNLVIKDGSGTYRVYFDENDIINGNFTGAYSIDREAGTITFTWDTGGATDSPTVMLDLINGSTLEVTAVSGSSITVGYDGSDSNAYVSGGVMAKKFEFYAETKPMNPFTDQNKSCRLKRVYFLIDSNTDNFTVEFYENRSPNPFLTKTLSGKQTRGDVGKKWVPLTVNQTAYFHRLKISQNTLENNGRIHAMLWDCDPVGSLG